MESSHDSESGQIRQFPVTPPRQDEVVIVNGPEDVDYDAVRPTRLSGALIEEVGGKDIPDFKLHQMSVAAGYTVTAKVRLVNLTDRHLLTDLPTNVRELAQKLFFRGESAGAKKPNKKVEMENQSIRVRDIARAYGCAGFLEPRLVLDQKDENTENNVLWVDRIPLHDLQEFMRICEGDDQLAARRLERFSE